MKIYSHRGESKYAPENTMSAFYLANFLNADGIETDVRKTKDNELVLIHDKTINRTSNSYGNVSDYTYEELLNFDFGNKYLNGEKIVKLDEFLKNFSDKDINIYIELKESGYEKLIVDCITRYNTNKVTLISFKYDILKEIRNLSDKINLGWLIYDLDNNIIEKSKKIDLSEIICNCISLGKKEVDIIKENKFLSVAWGVRNTEEIRRMEKIGVDIIICDSTYDVKKILDYGVNE